MDEINGGSSVGSALLERGGQQAKAKAKATARRPAGSTPHRVFLCCELPGA